MPQPYIGFFARSHRPAGEHQHLQAGRDQEHGENVGYPDGEAGNQPSADRAPHHRPAAPAPRARPRTGRGAGSAVTPRKAKIRAMTNTLSIASAFSHGESGCRYSMPADTRSHPTVEQHAERHSARQGSGSRRLLGAARGEAHAEIEQQEEDDPRPRKASHITRVCPSNGAQQGKIERHSSLPIFFGRSEPLTAVVASSRIIGSRSPVPVVAITVLAGLTHRAALRRRWLGAVQTGVDDDGHCHRGDQGDHHDLEMRARNRAAFVIARLAVGSRVPTLGEGSERDRRPGPATISIGGLRRQRHFGARDFDAGTVMRRLL